MKTYLALGLALLVVPIGAAAAAKSRQSAPAKAPYPSKTVLATQRTGIEAVLKSFQQALNASDVDGVVRLYTDDAVLLPANFPTAVGIAAVRATYKGIFQAIDFDLTFKIAEVKVVAPDWAFLRTSSKGTIKILAKDAVVPSSNHELFVLHKVKGQWKLARHSFSSVLPV